MRIEILVTDEDRDQSPDEPWLAQIRDVSAGPTDDVIGAAYGRSVREAIHRAADAVATLTHEDEEQR